MRPTMAKLEITLLLDLGDLPLTAHEAADLQRKVPLWRGFHGRGPVRRLAETARRRGRRVVLAPFRDDPERVPDLCVSFRHACYESSSATIPAIRTLRIVRTSDFWAHARRPTNAGIRGLGRMSR
jgi:hypothetical protein